MAGDWIKMRTGLQRSPRVVRIASALKADRMRVIGGLHAVWSLADEQTEDGVIEGFTFSTVDEMIGWPGFCDALKAVDWAIQDEVGVTFPRFEKHNGKSAKRRAQEADRKRSARSSASDADGRPQKVSPREEKRRSTPIVPVFSVHFESFWVAWPKSSRKGGKGECWKLWKAKGLDGQVADIVRHVEAMKLSADWLKDGGQFISAPLVYLRNRRWEGADLTDAHEPRRLAV